MGKELYLIFCKRNCPCSSREGRFTQMASLRYHVIRSHVTDDGVQGWTQKNELLLQLPKVNMKDLPFRYPQTPSLQLVTGGAQANVVQKDKFMIYSLRLVQILPCYDGDSFVFVMFVHHHHHTHLHSNSIFSVNASQEMREREITFNEYLPIDYLQTKKVLATQVINCQRLNYA